MDVSDLWSSFPHDPRTRANAGLRASDADRDRIAGVLSGAFADGRIDREELDERTDALTSARTLGDLLPLVSDLVPLKPAPTRPSKSLVGVPTDQMQRWAVEKWTEQRRGAVFGMLSSSLLFWGVWAFLGGAPGYVFIPIVATALGLLRIARVMTGRDEIVREEVRRLEKKQTRQQRWPKGLP